MAIDPLTAALSLGKEVVERLFPDPNKRAEQLFRLEELKQKGDLAELQSRVQLMLAQLKVNEADAKSGSFFQAGWRPMIGWTCGLIIFFNFIVIYCLEFYVASSGSVMEVPAPMEMAELWPVLMGMLGMGALRSHDKKHKIDTK